VVFVLGSDIFFWLNFFSHGGDTPLQGFAHGIRTAVKNRRKSNAKLLTVTQDMFIE
jgi:hypothetical protein